jgi:hypothetical protein
MPMGPFVVAMPMPRPQKPTARKRCVNGCRWERRKRGRRRRRERRKRGRMKEEDDGEESSSAFFGRSAEGTTPK